MSEKKYSEGAKRSADEIAEEISSDMVANGASSVLFNDSWNQRAAETISAETGDIALAEQIQSLSAENERLKQQNKDAFADYKKQWNRADAAEAQLSAAREALKVALNHVAYRVGTPHMEIFCKYCSAGRWKRGEPEKHGVACPMKPLLAQALEGDTTPDVETFCKFCHASRWKPRSREQHSDTCPIKMEGDKAL